jgi:hypothetical protein
VTLAEFFIQLASSEEAQREYAADRDAYIDRSELGPEDKELLKSGDLRSLRFEVEAEFEISGEAEPTAIDIIWIFPIWWRKTNDDDDGDESQSAS